jgi:superfamily II DNA or RNA helicase
MIEFEQITPGTTLFGLVQGQSAEIIAVLKYGPDAINVTFKCQGSLSERVLYRGDEAGLQIVAAGRNFGFGADAEKFRLVAEAQRIRLAHLFDPYLAVSASDIEALPHQITAVYGEMLPRQPLRFLLADDPGAGKTVMACLLIKELIIRGDLERCLIVAPGSLTEQWQDELAEKFDLKFEILTRDRYDATATGNPFSDRSRMILRLDMGARSDELKSMIDAGPDWDLIICDEAHRMSASFFGGEIKETARHKFGKLLGSKTRNLLLMSATPHNGKEEDFQLFMGLLDADRFEGRFREGAHKVDVADMMRRLTKEELYRFDGTALFPERLAYTASYELADAELSLYTGVTQYVREEMDKAFRGEDQKRRSNVGFALQILQRRLASSPAAIHRSLERRRKRLEDRLAEERLILAGSLKRREEAELPIYDADDLEDMAAEEVEAIEDVVLHRASAATNLVELEAEILLLSDLEDQALKLKLSGQDAKWRELEAILDDPIMHDEATGLRRKLLIFTEPKDTLEYLQGKIAAIIGDPTSVVVIHGGVPRNQRRAAIAAFNSDPHVRVMIANDAAGEGVNLQRGAHLMVNYDLPWNPNKLEQRFGRIHRIGQTEVCHLWNLCAANTREGEVYKRLLEKLEEARKALGGKVFDVLGELFEGHALRDLLVDAVRYGERADVKAELFRKVDGAVDTEHIRAIAAERKLTREGMDLSAVAAIRQEMERASARRLQPHFIGAFFEGGFASLGGIAERRETGRTEITRVPPILKDRDRLIGRSDPVLDRYARITFDKSHIKGQPQAELIAPGHPLLDSLVDVILDRHGRLLAEGTIFVDETSDSDKPYLMFILEHAIRDGRVAKSGQPRVVSQRLQFVGFQEDGLVKDCGPAPHLDFRAPTADEATYIDPLKQQPWLSGDLENLIIGHAIAHLVPDHLRDIKNRRLSEIDRVESEVRKRLKREIDFWDTRAARLREEERAGKENRMNAANADALAERLTIRLRTRQDELAKERDLSALPPRSLGVALVIPKGWLRAQMPPPTQAKPFSFADDPAARAIIEQIAMNEVMAAETAMGHTPLDVSAQNKGYDIESVCGNTGSLRFIEVKGRAVGGDVVMVTRNELMCALNKGSDFALAIVQVEDGFGRIPVYVRNFVDREPGFAETAVAFDINKLMSVGTMPQ